MVSLTEINSSVYDLIKSRYNGEEYIDFINQLLNSGNNWILFEYCRDDFSAKLILNMSKYIYEYTRDRYGEPVVKFDIVEIFNLYVYLYALGEVDV